MKRRAPVGRLDKKPVKRVKVGDEKEQRQREAIDNINKMIQRFKRKGN